MPREQARLWERLLTVIPLSAAESPHLPASLPAVRVLPAPASPVSGWEGRGSIGTVHSLSEKGLSIKTRFSHQKSWHLSSTFTEGKWQRTGCPSTRVAEPPLQAESPSLQVQLKGGWS